MIYFDDETEMLQEAELLIKEDRTHDEDRATIEAFYSGKPTMTEAEAENQGVTELVNHLFAHRNMSDSAGAVFAIYNKGKNFLKVDIPGAEPEVRERIESVVNKAINKAIRRSKRFKPHWRAISGQLTLHGSGMLMFADETDWCPRACRPLVPRGAGTRARDLSYAVVPARLSLSQLQKYHETAERLKEDGIDTGWRTSALKKVIEALKQNVTHDLTSTVAMEQRLATEDFQDRETSGDRNPNNAIRVNIPVFYVYEVDQTKPGRPVSLTIVQRYPATQRKNEEQRSTAFVGTAESPILFKDTEMYATPEAWLHTFFADVQLGSETKWHLATGLGKINYEPDVDVEEFFNDAMRGSREMVSRLYRVTNAANMEDVRRFIIDDEHSNVMPQGVELVEQGKGQGFQHAFNIVDRLMGQSDKNASGMIGSSGEAGSKELEVQALERQGRNAQAFATRMSDIYEDCDSLAEEMFVRFHNTEVYPTEDGATEIEQYLSEIIMEGIDPRFLIQRDATGKLANVNVRVSRESGDGDRVKEVMTNNMLLSRLQFFSPRAQQILLHRFVATQTDDYELADVLVPVEREREVDQIDRARTENNSCWLQGATGQIPPIEEGDIDLVHIPEHMTALQGLVASGEQDLEMGGQGWTAQHFNAFRCLGAHTVEHINRVGQINETVNLSRQLMAQLQNLSARGEALAANMQSRGEQASEQQMKQADLQLKMQKQSLSERAQLAIEEDRDRKFALDVKKEANRQFESGEKQISEEAKISEQGRANRANETLQLGAMALTEQKQTETANT